MILCDVYTRPHGEKNSVIIKNINPEDAEYIEHNGIKISMEEIPCGNLGYDFAIYFDYGAVMEDDEDEPDEIVILAKGRNCADTISQGVDMIKKAKEKTT